MNNKPKPESLFCFNLGAAYRGTFLVPLMDSGVFGVETFPTNARKWSHFGGLSRLRRKIEEEQMNWSLCNFRELMKRIILIELNSIQTSESIQSQFPSLNKHQNFNWTRASKLHHIMLIEFNQWA